MGMLIHRHKNGDKKEKPEVTVEKKPEPPVRRTRKTK